MLRANRTMILGILFVIPVLLCFIGIGAFLHVAVRAAAVQDEQLRDQVEKESEDAERRRKAIEDIERRIEEIRRKLAEMLAADELREDVAQLRARREELERELSSLSAELEKIQKQFQETTGDTDDLRGRLAEARKRLEELRQEIEAMAPASEGEQEDEQPTKGPSAEELAREIANAKRILEQQQYKNEQAQAELGRLRQEAQDGSEIRVDEIAGSHVWQPPPNPLYVECDGQGIVLQPESIRLPAEPDRAQRDRFVQTGRRRGYVLFLIRPDGFESFRQYRSLVTQGGIDFGYEPINQDGRVFYPERK